MFGEIETLVRKIDYSSMKAEHSIKKVGNAGNAVRQSALSDAGAGGVNFAANIENQRRFKKGSVNAFQNAMSMMQAQSDAIRQADKIYNQMRTLAHQAADPLMNDQDRSLLSDQFNDLRERARELGNSKFNDVYLFDGRAASTKYEINFSEGLTNDTPSGGSFVDENGDTLNFWEVTKDVIYNTGKISIDVNGGRIGERYILKQGEKIIFDTDIWETNGNAKQYDYDRFIVEWGPGKPTTFQFIALSDGNSTGVDLDGADGIKGTPDDGVLPSDSNFDNKSFSNTKGDPSGYLQQLGLSDDGTSSGVESIQGRKFTSLGQVNAFTSDPNSTSLTLRIESSSLFQIDSSYELPEIAPEIVARNEDMQVELERLGLGLLRDPKENGFPLISIDTFENAGKAIASLSNEIDGLGKQLGRLASNFNRVQNAIGATEEMGNIHESVLSSIGGDGLTQDLLNISKARINRAQDTALLSQAMSIHQDLVNVLI